MDRRRISFWALWTGDGETGCLRTAAGPQPIPLAPGDLARGLKPVWRRRLDLFGRAAAEVLGRVLILAPENGTEDADNPALVFASRHGNIDRTLTLLGQILTGEPPSPTQFSQSVHNALPGIASINWGITRAHTAIAAGPDSLVAGLTEALCLGREDPAWPCLLVYVDLPLPPVYAAFDPAITHPTALALRLEREEAAGSGPLVTFRPLSGTGPYTDGPEARAHQTDGPEAHARALARLLAGSAGPAATLRGETFGWEVAAHG